MISKIYSLKTSIYHLWKRSIFSTMAFGSKRLRNHQQ